MKMPHWLTDFTHHELACPCCGALPDNQWHLIWVLQRLRNEVNQPLFINSAHRCPLHNARVGGAPRSYHKQLAFDISTNNIDRHQLYHAAQKVGFTGFGLAKTFLHVDLGPPRRWYYRGSKQLWTG